MQASIPSYLRNVFGIAAYPPIDDTAAKLANDVALVFENCRHDTLVPSHADCLCSYSGNVVGIYLNAVDSVGRMFFGRRHFLLLSDEVQVAELFTCHSVYYTTHSVQCAKSANVVTPGKLVQIAL